MNKLKSKDLLNLALLAFAVFGLEILLITVESKIYGSSSFYKTSFQLGALHWLFTCILWGGGAFLLYKKAKKDGFNIFTLNKKPALIMILLAVLVVLSLTVVKVYLANPNFEFKSILTSIKPVREYYSLHNTYGSNGTLAFIIQHVYYAFESALILISIVFAQKAGEIATGISAIPWGGLFLGVTWGLIHVLTQGFATGIFALLASVLYGVVYLMLSKNLKLSYVFVFLMFVL